MWRVDDVDMWRVDDVDMWHVDDVDMWTVWRGGLSKYGMSSRGDSNEKCLDYG